MAKATGRSAVLAESDRTVIAQGNHYVPRDCMRSEYLRPSETHTECPWIGIASCHGIEGNGAGHQDAAWYYPDPQAAAVESKDEVAFWKGVRVES